MNLLAVLLMATSFASAPDKRPMTVDDLLAVKGVSDPQVSPDGTKVVYVVSEIDPEANKSNSSLWLVPVDGGEPKRLTTAPGSNNHPRWRPDGKSIAFVSDRSGSSQIWLLALDGGEPRQLTKLPIDASGPIWSPRSDKLAFTAEVYPGKSLQETADEDKKRGEGKSKVRVYDQLLFRHWNAWDDQKRSHLFVCDAETGNANDLMREWKVNVPPKPFGGSEEYCWRPDGKALAFTSEPLEDHALSTNTDIWLVEVDGGKPKNLTADNKGADAQPAFRPASKEATTWTIAYVRQHRAGFEADQWVLTVLGLAPAAPGPLEITADLDRPVQSFRWNEPKGVESGDRPDIFAVIDEGGYPQVVGLDEVGHRKPMRLLEGATFGVPHSARGAEILRATGELGGHAAAIVYLRQNANRPAEIYLSPSDGSNPRALTHHNDKLLDQLDLNPAERFTFSGANGDQVQGWLVKPPGFDPNKKYPLVYLIHGGPQGAWHDEWHNRWNYALFAAPGYCVVAVNPRGSTGFGQKFTDEISKDWNGRVYEDLMTGLDHALKTYSFLDGDRVAAAGGSFGGYMVNWIAGHTDRFKCLISHAGIFDLTSMNATTEELWFSTWEFGGMPWDTPELHRDQSPSTFVKNFKTPTLVIHGALDFRVPDAQGMGMFTALQKQEVPSRFVFFPDEGHWILKPGNRVAWWNEVHAWLAKYLKNGEK